MGDTEKTSKRAFAAVLVALALVATGLLSAHHGWLSLDELRAHREALAQIVEARPVAAAAGFAALYIAITALSIPGAVVMTLAAGALFGVVWG